MVIKKLVSISGPGQAVAIAPGGVVSLPSPGAGNLTLSGADVVPGAVIGLPGGGTFTVPGSVEKKPRQAKPPSRLKPFWKDAEREIMDPWFDENGYPRRGDGKQRELEECVAKWIKDHGEKAGKTAIRDFVCRYIKKYKAKVGAG